MTRAVVIIMLAAVFVVLLLVVLVQGLFVVTRFAVVDDMQGLVQVRDKGQEKWRGAAAGMLIRAGATIRVGKKGLAVLKWADGSRIKLDDGAQVIYHRWNFNKLTRASSASFYQLIGRTIFKVKKALGGSTKFEVHTPTVVAAVRGTTFDVRVLPDKSTSISVLDGSVGISGSGFEAGVAAGQEGATGLGGFHVNTMSEQRRSLWAREVGFAGPVLKVEDPEDGLKTGEPFAVVSGLTEPGVQVSVNDAKVPVDADGRFMARIPLQDGENKLKVAASEQNSQTTAARSVFYTNPAASISMSASPGEREDQALISVRVLDAENRPVPDGTLVRFAATLGKITEEARTKGGQASVILEAGSGPAGAVRITSSTGRAQAEVTIQAEAAGAAPAPPQPTSPQPPSQAPAQPAPAPTAPTTP